MMRARARQYCSVDSGHKYSNGVIKTAMCLRFALTAEQSSNFAHGANVDSFSVAAPWLEHASASRTAREGAQSFTKAWGCVFAASVSASKKVRFDDQVNEPAVTFTKFIEACGRLRTTQKKWGAFRVHAKSAKC